MITSGAHAWSCDPLHSFGRLCFCICFLLSFLVWCIALRHHMEPEWSAVELLDCIDIELDPGLDVEQRQHSSQAIFTAIRVLPAPEAGDLFVTAAARGSIGVVLFYHEEGGPPRSFA